MRSDKSDITRRILGMQADGYKSRGRPKKIEDE